MQSNLISQWKQWLLPAYYYGTLPFRQLGSSIAAAVGRQPIAVLFYHRVADENPSPWTISNRQFTLQVDWLTKHFDLISLTEAQQRINNRENRRPAVCITFDDGYADNCHHALPLLISRQIPVTYFVSTDFIERAKPFPHDLPHNRPPLPNTISQLKSLAAAGVEIGAHTRTHADLGLIVDREQLLTEIGGSRDDLQNWLGRRIRHFAFPYGQYRNLSPMAFQIAREAGFDGVCSAYGGYNLPGDDPFHLQRIHADPHFPRFKNWLTFEPRVLTAVRRFEYSPDAAFPEK